MVKSIRAPKFRMLSLLLQDYRHYATTRTRIASGQVSKANLVVEEAT